MAESLILPVSQPFITSWSNHSHILSVIARNSDSRDWILSNYIQLELIKELNGNRLLLNYSFVKAPEDDCPWLNVARTSRKAVEDGGGVVAFLKQRIQDGQYIYLFLDTFYLSAYPFYAIESSPHDPMIIGFNDSSRVFYLADFHLVAGGINKYGTFEIPYEQLEQSFYNLHPDQDYLRGIELFSYRTNALYGLNMSLIQLSLSDYLNAEFTQAKELNWLSTPVKAYGVAVYDHLLAELERMKEANAEPDFRLIHVFNDHKILMQHRLHHLKEKGIISAELACSYDQIAKDSNALRQKALKFGVTRARERIAEAADLVKLIRSSENRVLQSVIDELRLTELQPHT
ncbi:hypothetical protein [Cohnella boryungensis]|uniref:Butirosin biosynthesis protein H N-terminal domain-containing protein n=1 Tax=Cohnella boryungensis TaxID=768479 RepID=A0ABV8S4D8_9BACL